MSSMVEPAARGTGGRELYAPVSSTAPEESACDNRLRTVGLLTGGRLGLFHSVTKHLGLRIDLLIRVHRVAD